MFWGTERTLDDRNTRIFRIPEKQLDHVRGGRTKKLSEYDLPGGESIEFVKKYYFWGGSILIAGEAHRYWEERQGGISATAGDPEDEDWPKGSEGVYFDFVPANGGEQKSILLFILFEEKVISAEKKEQCLSAQKNLIETWRCLEPKPSEAEPIKTGTLVKKESIATSMSEPFYVFQEKDDYYFTTISGKIYVARLARVDPKKIEGLIADLDSELFATREKATENLRTLGRQAQPALECRLAKEPISAEQKRRITRLIGELKRRPDRETQLLWQDEKRPVEKLLFDQDKDKVYAFTKPDKEKRVWFFEITEKPEPRLYTGKADAAKPESLPASVQTFVEYARFVRQEK
jgi:hypothetical protein